MKKKLLSILFVFVVLLALPFKSYSSQLNLLEMNVDLLDNGTAAFTTRFQYDDSDEDEGTEHYFVLSNLQDTELENFTVTRNGKEMEFVENWNVNGDFNEKIDKYGIVKTNEGYELCYGISEKTENVFELKYNLTNFVKQSNDYQFLNWEFISSLFGDEIDYYKLTIGKQEYEFNKENSKIWAFGYNGKIEFENGKIIAKATSGLSDNDYSTVLVKFENKIFNTNSYIDKNFSEIKNIALENSSYNQNENNGIGGDSNRDKMPLLAKVVLGGIAGVFGIIITLLLIWQNKRVKKPEYEGSTVEKIKIKKTKNKGEYFQTIPYEGKIEDIFIIIKKYDYDFIKNYISAYLLKWIHDEKITVIKVGEKSIFNKEKVNFKLVDMNNDYTGLEYDIFSAILYAAGKDMVLDEKEFSKWMKNNYKKFDDYLENAEENSRNTLLEKKYFYKDVKIGTFSKTTNITPTEKGEELIENIVKFENYLKEYSLLNSKDSYNVKIWDEYMIYAALLGIADEVEKEFKNIYPNYVEESSYNFATMYLIMHFSNSAYSSYGAVSSAGFGGAASIGGGGGSFGGGGGGTR